MHSHERALLIILDGFGIGKDSPFNAIENAKMPFYRDLIAKYPSSQLVTHGQSVGLPDGVMGNSEVGHMTMGAGRIIYQDLTRITNSIADKSFFRNAVLQQAIEAGAKTTGRVHLMGLLSDGGVHSHMDHLFALLDLCAEMGVPNVSVHPFLDGRDTPPNSSFKYIDQLLAHPTLRPGQKTKVTIASVTGRYYAMDRDKRWERIALAYNVLTGQSEEVKISIRDAVTRSHGEGKNDEFVDPVLLDASAAMRNGDSVIFFNYRADRAREITQAITKKEFTDFNRGRGFKPSSYAGMTVYDAKFAIPSAYAPQNLNHIFGQCLEERKLTQLRIAETEKYAHVTFFFNGGREKPFQGEERLLIPSPREVATYDQKPEMSAFQIASEASAKLRAAQHDFMLMNFANADMIGHTGNYKAAIQAIEVLDQCLAEVVGAAQSSGYHTLITADHGNAEEMIDCNGHLHTQHTLNPVPAIWIAPNSAIAPRSSRQALKDGTLEDVMPTLCDLMKLPQPSEATGKSLLPK